MKLSLIVSALFLVGSCANLSHRQKIAHLEDSIVFDDSTAIQKYSKHITVDGLKDHVYTLASPEMEGRATGQAGFDMASTYIKDFYQNNAIPSPSGPDTYYQKIPRFQVGDTSYESHNVIAYIEGSQNPEEVIILSAHLDHLGIEGASIYQGADDNASGTAALLEMAKAFATAKKEGFPPKRSMLFLHVTAEEIGLFGSKYYIDNPMFPLEKTVVNLNMDMIGRVDKHYHDKQIEDYVYLIGADRLSTQLHLISEAANANFTNLELDYSYNKEHEPNRYYYRSDHYNFASNNIPVIFYFNGEHEDYHLPTDTPDKINYPLLQKRTQLIFSTAWYLANSKERLQVDKL